jgi:dolichol kinase
MVSTGDALGLLLVYLYVGAVVIFARLLDRKGFDDCKRKTVHVLIGNIVFIWWVFDSPYIMAFLAAAPFIPLLYLVSPACRSNRFKRTFLGSATKEGHDLGLMYYAVSWTLLAFFLFDYRAAASVGIVSMAYGDGMGGFLGKKIGKRKFRNGKSLEGTLAVLTTTTISVLTVLMFYQWLDSMGIHETSQLALPFIIALSLFMGIYVAIVELITPGKYDNLIIPISTSLIMVVLGV